MQIQPAWDPSEYCDHVYKMTSISLITVHKRCLLLFSDSLRACPSAPLLVGVWTMAKLVHQSVVGPVRERGLLRLAKRGFMVNQGMAEKPSSPCWRRGGQSHLHWAILHTRHLLAFHCIFIHPRNLQPDWAGDTTARAGVDGWCLAAAHVTRVKDSACPQRCGKHRGMYTAEARLSEGPPILLTFLTWRMGEMTHTMFSRSRRPDYRDVMIPSEHSVWSYLRWVSMVLGG